MNDLYDTGIKDDRFTLISKMNEKCNVKVKTPVGDTDRFTLKHIEMQGTVPAPLKCAVQMDTIGIGIVRITIQDCISIETSVVSHPWV